MIIEKAVDPIAKLYLNNEMSDWRQNISYPSVHSFAVEYIGQKLESHDNFEWNRGFYEEGSFDDMNFRYKDNVFSVLYNVYYNGILLPIARKRKQKLLAIAKKNNLIPCVFPVVITDIPGLYKISCKTDQMNLFDLRNKTELNPVTIASDKLVPRSHYELLNTSIKYVYNLLGDEGYDISTFWDEPDKPDDSPRIWFFDEKKRLCWVVVKYSRDQNIEWPDMQKMALYEPITGETTGYFAPVILESKEDDLYRGKPANILTTLKDVIVKIHDPFETSNS